MVVRRTKGATWFIRISSVLGIPIIVMTIIGAVHYIIEYSGTKYMIPWILACLLFLLLLCFVLILTIQAYKPNSNVLSIDDQILVIDIGYKKLHYPIVFIEKFDYFYFRGFTTIIIKVKDRRTKRISHFCNRKDLDSFKEALKSINKNTNI